MAAAEKVFIHYLYHSGFAVEYNSYFLVFDYYRNGSYVEKAISGKPDTYVFSSHGHFDHFNSEIFDWLKINPDIKYILSSDIRHKVKNTKCSFLGPYEKLQMNGLKVSTYGSTDIGVSFLVDINGLSIFHAGDLNWWHWADESTESELAEAESLFKKEVTKFENEKIDIMFFPVDPRLGRLYYLGGEYMIQKFRPQLFIPMHFGDHPEITGIFAEKAACPGVRIAKISEKGQTIELDSSQI